MASSAPAARRTARRASGLSRAAPPAWPDSRPTRVRRSGRCPPRTTPAPGSAASTRSPRPTSGGSRSPSRSRPASPAGKRRRRWSSATRCTSSRRSRTSSMRWISRSPARRSSGSTSPADAAAQGVACCDVVNRGAVYWDGKIFFNTLDGNTVAVDADTGKEVWKTKLGDINKGESITMAPLVVKGKVLVGNSGGEFGVRGWLTALDARTGKLAWRAYTTGPDSRRAHRAALQAVLPPGPRTGPRCLELAARRVEERRRRRYGDGSRYDPELNLDLLRHGESGAVESGAAAGRQQVDGRRSSRATPTPARRSGPTSGARTISTTTTASTKARCSTCRSTARRARSSSGRSATATSTCIDRATGEVLSADPYGYITTTRASISRAGGRSYEPGEGAADGEGGPRHLPRRAGRQGLAAVGLLAAHRTALHAAPEPVPGRGDHRSQLHRGHAVRRRQREDVCRARAAIAASSRRGTPSQRREVWTVKENFPVWSGALVTAGDVVFYGTMDGWFKALDARSGNGALAVQDGLGDHRAADHVPGAGRQAVRRGARRAWAGGPAPSWPATSTSRDSSAALGFVERHEGSADGDDERRDAVCLRLAVA